MLHAGFGADFRCLEAIQVCTVLEWLCNNIACDFNIAFCQTFEHRHEIWQLWNANLTQKTVLAVVGAIFEVYLPDFGAIQVFHIVKWMRSNILSIYNIKPCPNFWNHAEIRSIFGKIKTWTHADWLSILFRLMFGHQNLRPDSYSCI